MRVVLREATYTRQPVELTALLVAIDRTELSQTLGQVTIGVRAERLEDLTVGEGSSIGLSMNSSPS